MCNQVLIHIIIEVKGRYWMVCVVDSGGYTNRSSYVEDDWDDVWKDWVDGILCSHIFLELR